MMIAGRAAAQSLVLLAAAVIVATCLGGSSRADEQIVAYRLEIAGDVHVRVAGNCRILKSAHRLSSEDKWISFVDRAPLQFDVSGAAVECVVRKVAGDGGLAATLRRGDGVPIAYYTLATRKHQLRLRSVGPWGVGGARVLAGPQFPTIL